MQQKPSTRIALIVGLLYAPVFTALLLWSGVPYPQLADSQDTIFRAVLVPEAILAVALIGLVTWLGWWRPILFDDKPAPTWLKLFPVLFALSILAALAENFGVLSGMATSLLVTSLVATLLVGFCEELVYRGVAVVGLRASRPEWQVWLISSLMFAALHAWNFVSGQDLASTALQVVVTFGIGSVLYACRRATGTILVPMLLHGLYDFLSFGPVSGMMNIGVVVMLIGIALALGPLLIVRRPKPGNA